MDHINVIISDLTGWQKNSSMHVLFSIELISYFELYKLYLIFFKNIKHLKVTI